MPQLPGDVAVQPELGTSFMHTRHPARALCRPLTQEEGRWKLPDRVGWWDEIWRRSQEKDSLGPSQLDPPSMPASVDHLPFPGLFPPL